MALNIKTRRQKASRYYTEDDDDDMGGGAQHAAAMSTMPPGMCAVFKNLDPDENEASEIDASNKAREEVIGKLRALNLNVDQFMSSDKKYIFVVIGAPETMLKYEAEAQRAKIRLTEAFGGALCYYSQELDEKKAYGKPMDGFELFSSAVQLKLIDEVVRSRPYGDDEKQEPIDFDELILDEKVETYFPLHHSRMRMKLMLEWAMPMTKPQPLDMVREYFGEQIALFYTWYGFYNTMTFIPAILGVLLVLTQVYSYYEMNHSTENPFVLIYAVALVLWALTFCQLWISLENSRKYEWDTLDFENDEKVREEFMESPEVIRDEMINEVSGEPEEFYYPEGSWLPPTGRARKQLLTFVVIIAVNFVSIFVSMESWKVAVGMMKPGDYMVGAIAYGLANAVVSTVIDCIMDGVPQLDMKGFMSKLVEGELWKTDTEHQDNVIIKTFYYKIVTKYFSLFLVVFGVNYFPIFGSDLECPDRACYPVLEVTYVTIVLWETAYSIVQSNLFPILKQQVDSFSKPVMPDKMGVKVHKSPIEEQFEWFESPPVIDFYKDKVYQFGYIAMFGVLSPLLPAVILAFNTVDLRQRAMSLLTKNKRPEPFVAADIGTYQTILEVLATLSVITNAVLVVMTCHGLFFYLSWMGAVDRMWGLVLFEHILLFAKVVVSSIVPTEPKSAILHYNVQQEKKAQQLKIWDVEFDD